MKLMLRFAGIAVYVSVLLSWISPAARAAELDRTRSLGAGRYELTGEFGPRCNTCEVVFVYSDGLRYAHRVIDWSPKRIVVEVPDLNRSVDVGVLVRTAARASRSVRLRLARTVVPERAFGRAVTDSVAQQYGFFERSHHLAVGDKGEDAFDVSTSPPGCNRAVPVFDHAEIVYKDQRFGQAQIVSAPPPGCVRCPPLKIRWYHEPTGRLTYQVHVYRRVIEGMCPDRVR